MKEREVIKFEALGAEWQIKILGQEFGVLLVDEIRLMAFEFENKYSRFKNDSLLRKVSGKVGIFEVGPEFVEVLKRYKVLFDASEGRFTPLLGGTLSDMGYDENYSLKEKEVIRVAPNFEVAVRIIDSEQVEFIEPVDLDFGGLGKGFLIDKIKNFLEKKGVKKFLINGSGDIFYSGHEKIKVGLEDPFNSKRIIGIMEMKQGGMCASANNRRAWKNFKHIVDPGNITGGSKTGVVASWVYCGDVVTADAIATSLFFCDAEELKKHFEFEYLIMNSEYKVLFSKGFKLLPAA